jgi:hypothetical protein
MRRSTSVRLPRRAAAPRLLAVACVVAAISAAAAPAAMAEDPTSAQYETPVTRAAETGGPRTPSAPSSGLRKAVVGGLPFTGLDLIALVAVAFAFTSVGFALRRLTVAQRTDPR